MAAVLGRNFLLSVFDDVSAYNDVAGQKDGKLTISGKDADVRTKSDAGAPNKLPESYDWQFEASGDVTSESDTALVALRTAVLGITTKTCRFTSPDGHTYTGLCTVASFDISGPDDNALSWSVSLNGAGALSVA